MEGLGSEVQARTERGARRQDPGDPRLREGPILQGAASWAAGAQGSIPRRSLPTGLSWQSALYVFVLGAICVLLAPLTNLWWLVLVCGTAVPVALATLDRAGLMLKSPIDRKAKEQELLHALADRGHLTPTTAALRTSLTVEESSKMLEELAREDHLELQAEDGIMAYALRDQRELPGQFSRSSEVESDGDQSRLGTLQLDEPLSEREFEVLALMSSGRTNAEIARDLFVAIGTVKSHTGNIYRKLGAKNRAEAIARSRKLELLR